MRRSTRRRGNASTRSTAFLAGRDPERCTRLIRGDNRYVLPSLLPQQFGAILQHTDSAANLGNYEPDFVAATTDGQRHLVETRGREDADVAHKGRAARIRCENASLLTGAPWTYLKLPQREFEKLQPADFADLAVLGRVSAARHGASLRPTDRLGAASAE